MRQPNQNDCRRRGGHRSPSPRAAAPQLAVRDRRQARRPPQKTVSGSEKPGGPAEKGGAHDAIVAEVAQKAACQQRHGSARRSGHCSRAGRADTSSPAIRGPPPVRSVVSHPAVVRRARPGQAEPGRKPRTPSRARAAPSPPRPRKAGHDAIVAEVAQKLHVSTARVSAALRPLFAAGRGRHVVAGIRGRRPVRSGVSTQQLSAALRPGQAEPGRRQLTQTLNADSLLNAGLRNVRDNWPGACARGRR